ncbi:MAG: c-type cytochrome, partial [Ardenticatenaceae bacterium]
GAEEITPISDGATLYRETCASCHGPEGEGVANLGSALVGSEFTLNTPDEEWISFVREGRPADHPDNKSGIAMPPSGGRSDLSDDDLQAIFSYLRLNSRP